MKIFQVLYLTVRARLMLAFAIMSISALIVAFVGWRGLGETENALSVFKQDALPDISRSLELAERTANLAALAPHVTSVSSPLLLQGLTKSLEEKIEIVLDLAPQVPQLDASVPKLRKLLESLDVAIGDLVVISRQQLFLREDSRERKYLLDKLKGSLLDITSSELEYERYLRAFDLLYAASLASTFPEITDFELRFDHQLERLSQITTNKKFIDKFNKIAKGEHGVISLRKKQLEMQERRAFLISYTRAISEQLSLEVAHFVKQVEHRIEGEQAAVGEAVKSGKTGILLISFLSILSAVSGIWVVRELTYSLNAVTNVMTRLAKGDIQQETPAIGRRDEIGDLARAFQVFRENAVTIDRISLNLKEQAQLLEAVFTNMNDGLSVFDRTGRLVAWNPQYLSILELPEGKVHKGMKLDEVHALLAKKAQESWTLDGVALDPKEVNILRYMQSQCFERHFANGRVVEFKSNPMPEGGFVTLYSDFTVRKAIEAQLRQSQKMEVLGQLTGGVAHDFNNLLAIIFGNLQLLESAVGRNEKALHYVRRALSASDRGKSLTQRLLAFSRKQNLQPEDVDVDRLVEGMMDLVEYSVGEGVEIEVSLRSKPWVATVDPSQLENALLNLAINSSSAMKNGGRLSFTTNTIPAVKNGCFQGDHIHIAVEDSGCGISEPHLRRAFEPFFTTKEIGEGSGLGLSMVYGFVKQSGGDIQIQSEVEKGTCINIYLPRASEDNMAPQRRVDESIEMGQGEWVLMVEDDEQVCVIGEELLTSINYNVVAVSSAKRALEILEIRKDISILFTDINLGTSFTGVQLADVVRQRWPHIAVLITSGLTTQNPNGLGESGHPETFLLKPYLQVDLSVALQKAKLSEKERGHREIR